MVLRIMKEYNPEFDATCMVIKSAMLEEKSTHLFIASHQWDKIIVELHPKLNPATLHYISGVAGRIEVICDRDKLSDYMSVLVELYPDKQGAIRRSVMQKQDVLSVLGDDVLCRE